MNILVCQKQAVYHFKWQNNIQGFFIYIFMRNIVLFLGCYTYFYKINMNYIGAVEK